MKLSRRSLRALGITGLLLLVVGVAAIAMAAKSDGPLGWRLTLYNMKVQGNLEDLSWRELLVMTADSNRYGLSRVRDEGRSLAGALMNPYVDAQDRAAGAEVFKARCSACHGNDGSGAHGGASLLRENYLHGDTEMAVYKVVRDGVPGTAMVPAGLSYLQRWQVIGYVRTLQATAVGQAAPEHHDRHFEISSDALVAADADAGEWRMYSRTYNGWRYSPLKDLKPDNVSRLQLRWVHQIRNGTQIEGTPLVIDDTVLMSESPSNLTALDANTGRVLWRYQRDLPTKIFACCGWVNRGVAALGNQVFLGTLDAHLVAIDARTGSVRWDTVVADWSKGYSITGAPLVVADTIVVGVAGGEYGIRGVVVAYDAASGKERWRFNTIPGPNEPGHETWENDAWRTGGGATWVTGVYDPSLQLLYWGVGNPAPDYQGKDRPGDNLYSDSVVALNAMTGKLAWHFQFTPHDEHDWDANQTPLLIDQAIDGVERKLLVTANRNGFYYVLDRATGEFLRGVPFSKQTWAKGLTSTGRPILSDTAGTPASGSLTFPGVAGAANWQPPAFNPELRLFFVHANEQGSVFTKTAAGVVEAGGDGLFVGSGAANVGPVVPVIRALGAVTGDRAWEYASPEVKAFGGVTGLLATAGGLVVGASGGTIFALDAKGGREAWRLPLGGDTYAPPISFRIGGQQALAIIAGRGLFVFTLAAAAAEGDGNRVTSSGQSPGAHSN